MSARLDRPRTPLEALREWVVMRHIYSRRRATAESANSVYFQPPKELGEAAERLHALGFLEQCGTNPIGYKIWKVVDLGGED